jgi:hypothetical protein
MHLKAGSGGGGVSTRSDVITAYERSGHGSTQVAANAPEPEALQLHSRQPGLEQLVRKPLSLSMDGIRCRLSCSHSRWGPGGSKMGLLLCNRMLSKQIVTLPSGTKSVPDSS